MGPFSNELIAVDFRDRINLVSASYSEDEFVSLEVFCKLVDRWSTFFSECYNMLLSNSPDIARVRESCERVDKYHEGESKPCLPDVHLETIIITLNVRCISVVQYSRNIFSQVHCWYSHSVLLNFRAGHKASTFKTIA